MRTKKHFRFPKMELALAFAPQVPDEEAGRRMKRVVMALASGKRGVDDLADRALDADGLPANGDHFAGKDGE